MELFSDESDVELFAAGVFDSDSSGDFEDAERRDYVRINHTSALSDSEFVFRFRLDKTSVNDLLNKITPTLRVTSSRNHGIAPLHQLLLTLRFYALGTMLLSVADFVGVSKSSASRIVRDVSRAVAGFYADYVKMLENTANSFHDIAGFPRVFGAIDCTHIPIQSPDLNIGEEFRNRKGTLSLNVQGVCNAELLFMNVVARWPGSSHDATIFNNSVLKMQCEDGILGNKWHLLTPLLNPVSAAENRYNEAHIKTRNTIERCFGVWKRRFPVLSLKLRLALPTTQAVIIATSVLHNICRLNNINDVEPEIVIPFDEWNAVDGAQIGEQMEPANQNNNTRRELISNYFSRI